MCRPFTGTPATTESIIVTASETIVPFSDMTAGAGSVWPEMYGSACLSKANNMSRRTCSGSIGCRKCLPNEDADGLKGCGGRERRSRRYSRPGKKAVFSRGYINYLGLLSAEQAYQQAVITLAQAQGNRYADTAALFQALGGGWWNRSDVRKNSLEAKSTDVECEICLLNPA